MDASTLKQVVAQIHRRYPEFANVLPKVREQTIRHAQQTTLQPTFLLTFHSSAKTASRAGVKTLPRVMRVVVDERGKILKVTTSR
jgi:hypothetical protein